MKRVFQCIFILSLLCIPLISEAITVTISEVDPLWRPEASTKGNLSIAWVNATISGIDPKKDQYKRIIISLNAVSTKKGICCNGTYEDYVKDAALKKVYSSTSRDMIFRKEENGGYWTVLDNRRLQYEVPSDEKKIKTTVTLPVGVFSLDFGGYGEVHGAVYRKKTWSNKYVSDSSVGNITHSQIPRDKNQNGIADSWNRDYYALNSKTGKLDAKLFRDFGNKADIDPSPGTKNKGDNITAFEEYRGFLVWEHEPREGRSGQESPGVTHTRTSPDTKTMFVVNEDTNTIYQGTGTGLNYISQYLLPSSLVKADGWVNFNDNNGLSAFSVKIVSNTTYESGKLAKYGLTTLGPPHAKHKATVYTTQIELDEDAAHEKSTISHTIGHELGHAAHLEHCPKSDIKDAKGNDKGWDKKCLMWPAHDNAQGGPAAHHDLDYALAKPEQAPQTPVELDSKGKPLPKKAKLVPYNGLYTANAGDSHTAKFTAPAAYSSVYWYVKSPSDTSTYGTTQEIDQGDGSTKTAEFTYTFPSGVSGKYQIMAYVYGSNNTVYEEKYTVNVKATTTTTTTTTPTTATYSLTSSDGVYTATAGTGHEANFNSSSAYTSVSWYLKKPSDASAVFQRTDSGNGSSTTAQFGYSFPSGVSGSYVFKAMGTIGDTAFDVSYTVSVKAPTLTFSPTVSGIADSYSPGDTANATITTGGLPIYGVWMFANRPWPLSKIKKWYPGSQTTTSLNISCPVPDEATSGQFYTWTLYVYPWDGNTYGTQVMLHPRTTIK